MATTTERIKVVVDTKDAIGRLNGLKGAFGALAGVIAINEIIQFGTAIKNTVAEFQSYENQLRLITDSQEQLNSTFLRLSLIADQTRTELGATIELFTKLRIATEELGISTDRVEGVTIKLQQALAVAGADAATTASVIRQFGQAMASGTVRGDEFNSLVEGLGPALSIMARETGITVGELRRMSQEGELTAETMFKLLENSNSLTAAFNLMEPTIAQLETALGNAFDRATAKIGEGILEFINYEQGIENITNALNRFNNAGTELDLTTKSIEELAAMTDRASAAQDELNRRYLEQLDVGIVDVIRQNEIGQRVLNGTVGEYLDLLKDAQEQLTANVQALQDQAAADKEVADAEIAAAKALEAKLEPFKESIELAEKYKNVGLENKIAAEHESQARLAQAIQDVNAARDQELIGAEYAEKLIKGLQAQYDITTESIRKLQDQLLASQPDLYQRFFDGLIDRTRETQQQSAFTQIAIQELTDKIAAGTGPVDVYKAALESLKDTLEDNNEELNKFKDIQEEATRAVESAADRIARAKEQALLSGLEGVERDLKAIELEEKRLEQQAIARVKAQSEGVDPAKVQEQIDAIKRSSQAAIAARQEAQRTIDANENQIKTFSEGWADAYEEYYENARDAAQRAEDVFKTATSGMEDAIVDFVKTGKLSFRDLISDILEQSLRANLRQIFSGILAPGTGSGQGVQDFFGGFFANGGYLPAGKFGVAGEAGPELINGPANITPLGAMGSTNNVTYNINAVDAMSFKQMIARDPQFIHAVATKGGQGIPVRR